MVEIYTSNIEEIVSTQSAKKLIQYCTVSIVSWYSATTAFVKWEKKFDKKNLS